MIELNCEKTFEFWINFQWQNLLKIHYFPNLKFKNFGKDASEQSHSSRAFQQYQELTLITFDFFKTFFVQYSITLVCKSKHSEITLVHH